MRARSIYLKTCDHCFTFCFYLIVVTHIERWGKQFLGNITWFLPQTDYCETMEQMMARAVKFVSISCSLKLLHLVRFFNIHSPWTGWILIQDAFSRVLQFYRHNEVLTSRQIQKARIAVVPSPQQWIFPMDLHKRTELFVQKVERQAVGLARTECDVLCKTSFPCLPFHGASLEPEKYTPTYLTDMRKPLRRSTRNHTCKQKFLAFCLSIRPHSLILGFSKWYKRTGFLIPSTAANLNGVKRGTIDWRHLKRTAPGKYENWTASNYLFLSLETLIHFDLNRVFVWIVYLILKHTLREVKNLH